jgi:2-polyprenyl-6-methoxyphenol hydroxylase-like FAD-dependent oxidoreductase
VREAIGAAVTDLGFQASWLVVFAELDDPDRELPNMPPSALVCDPDRPYMALRRSGGRLPRWEFSLAEDEDPAEMSKEGAIWGLLARFGVNQGNARLVRHTVFTFRSLVAEQWRSGRVFLAGDAAHVMPPFLRYRGRAEGSGPG